MMQKAQIILGPKLDIRSTHEDETVGKINRIYSVLYRERRDNVLQLLRQIPEFVKIAHELTTGKSYKVIMPNKDGYLGIRIDGSGFTPNIHGKDGKFIAQASLQEISPDLNNIVNQLANQNAFAEILQRLEVIDQKISEILVNDHGDRIARVNAGINLYHQAILAEPENRPLLLSNTITELQKGLESLVNELRNDIKFIEKLPRGYWSILFSAQTPHKRVDEKIKPMLEAYRAILRSAYFLPIAHEKMGNPKSQEFCLQQLKSVTEEFGQAYEKITCWLSPEDADNLGKTWVTSQQIASGIIPPSRQLGSGDSTDIEFQFTPTEITIA